MNPSAPDWIKKFLNLYKQEQLIDSYKDNCDFYYQLVSCGFIYGLSVHAVTDESVSNLELTKEEYTKVNLFHALLYTYFNEKDGSLTDAVEAITRFYKKLDKGKTGIFHKLSLSQSKFNLLEGILSGRLQQTNLELKKNAASLLTHALLYVDVISFASFLKEDRNIKVVAKELESEVITFCFLALKSKLKKSKYDLLIIDMFESSSQQLTHFSNNNSEITLEHMRSASKRSFLEKKYILDLCCLAVWDDFEMDSKEFLYLRNLTDMLQMDQNDLSRSLNDLNQFSEENTSSIKLFEYSHPVKQFYKQSTATVKLLIMRNQKRLLKELNESKELLILLGQSTLRDLNKDEKDKVREQLLDVCKSIPSLTIFLLPGGTVLLPLLVKFIPKLLPSAFDDNRIEVKKSSQNISLDDRKK